MAAKKYRRLMVWRITGDGKAIMVSDKTDTEDGIFMFIHGVGIATRIWPDVFLEKEESEKSFAMDTPSGKLLFFVERVT